MPFRDPTLVYWHGWNALALGLLPTGVAAAVVAWFLMSLILGETLLAQMLAFGVGGLTIACGDLIYRARNSESGKTWRFFSPVAGGSVVFVPAWWFGLGTMITAGLYAAGIAK